LTCRKQLTKVKVAGTVSKRFPVFQLRKESDGGLQTGKQMIANLRCADDIILLGTSEAELQELVNRLDRVSLRYSVLINIDKTKVMASDGIACRILIQNEQLVQVNMFPYLGSLITEDGQCTTEFRARLNKRAGDQGITTKKYGKVTSYPFQ